MESDWQSNMFSIRDRAKVLLEKELLTDVSFTFPKEGGENESKTLHAHKVLLAGSSPVLLKMFYGDLAENTEQAIEIVDIDSKTFSIMMKYIYTDNVEIEDWHSCAHLYAAAKKYLLNALSNYCIEFITKELKVDNALKIFEFANFYEEKQLKDAALKIIKEQTISVFESPGFIETDVSTMIIILEQDELQANEMDLYNALDWLAAAQGVYGNTNNQNGATNAVPIPESKQAGKTVSCLFSKFRQAIKKINFLEMTGEQFSTRPAFSKLFLPEEAVAILSCLIKRSNVTTRYPKDFVQNIRKKRLPRVFFDFSVGASYIARVVIELRSDVVPEVVEEFLGLCSGKKPIGYKGSFLNEDDYGEHIFAISVINFQTKKSFSHKINFENFRKNRIAHGVVTLLCDTSVVLINASQEESDYYFEDEIVIGEVVEGIDVVTSFKSFVSPEGKFTKTILILNCGEIDRP